MYGQGYRNKADRKGDSRFVVSKKISPDTGRKKGRIRPKEKAKAKLWQSRKYLIKPSAFESEIHPSHKSKICTQGISPCRGAKCQWHLLSTDRSGA